MSMTLQEAISNTVKFEITQNKEEHWTVIFQMKRPGMHYDKGYTTYHTTTLGSLQEALDTVINLIKCIVES